MRPRRASTPPRRPRLVEALIPPGTRIVEWMPADGAELRATLLGLDPRGGRDVNVPAVLVREDGSGVVYRISRATFVGHLLMRTYFAGAHFVARRQPRFVVEPLPEAPGAS